MKDVDMYYAEDTSNKKVVIVMTFDAGKALCGFIDDCSNKKKIPSKRTKGYKVANHIADNLSVW